MIHFRTMLQTSSVQRHLLYPALNPHISIQRRIFIVGNQGSEIYIVMLLTFAMAIEHNPGMCGCRSLIGQITIISQSGIAVVMNDPAITYPYNSLVSVIFQKRLMLSQQPPESQPCAVEIDALSKGYVKQQGDGYVDPHGEFAGLRIVGDYRQGPVEQRTVPLELSQWSLRRSCVNTSVSKL